MKTVAEVMSKGAKTVDAQDTVGTALRMMDEHGIRHLPVLEHGALVGIVSDRDLRSCQPPLEGEWDRIDYAMRLLEQPVRQHMTPDPYSVTTDAPISEAVDKVVNKRIGCLCVIDQTNSLVGVISQLDLLAELRPR
jgi:acetoin utilization protein AcuB